MAQPIQEFTPFTPHAWDLARGLVKDHFGVDVTAASGTIDKDGFVFEYTYDAQQKSFRIQLTHWPWFTSAVTINEKIHMLCENAMIQGEDHAAAAQHG